MRQSRDTDPDIDGDLAAMRRYARSLARDDQDADDAVADPVRAFQGSHCGVHLPVGWVNTLTVRTGPPGCRPLSKSVRSHR